MNHEKDYDRDYDREDTLTSDKLKEKLQGSLEKEKEMMKEYLNTAERIHDEPDKYMARHGSIGGSGCCRVPANGQ